MRTIAIAAAAILACGAEAGAVSQTALPTDNIVLWSGYEWAWASPCGPSDLIGSESCSVQDFSVQALSGWRLPQGDEWLALPDPALFEGRCSAAWFDTRFVHCDAGNAFWTPTATSPWNETIAIREAPGQALPFAAHYVSGIAITAAPPTGEVPLPAAAPLLAGALAAAAALARRRS